MKKRGIPAWLSSPLFLPLVSAIACISVMYGRNHGKLLLPEDSAYLALTGARNLASSVARGLESGAMTLPQLENPLYAAIVLPGALLCRLGEYFAPAIWLILLGLGFSWWLIRTVKSLGKLLVGGWAGDALVVALGVSSPIVVAMFSCGGVGLQAVIVAALWLSWIDSGQGRSRLWWLSPFIFSFASVFSGSNGWTYPLVCALTAAYFYSRAGGIHSRRVWPAILIGFIPALLMAATWTSGNGIFYGSIPETYFPSVLWLSKSYSLIPPIIWQGIWPASVNPVMLPGAGLLFLLGLMQPGNNRIWCVMGGLIVLVGVINGGMLSVSSFTPFIVISFSGIVRLSEMVPESWRKGLLKTAVWGWILCAVIGLVLNIDQYGEKSARALSGTVNMMGKIPAKYSGMILADNPGLAA